jgi:hypothetical protein
MRAEIFVIIAASLEKPGDYSQTNSDRSGDGFLSGFADTTAAVALAPVLKLGS